jgi:hypothetical protein
MTASFSFVLFSLLTAVVGGMALVIDWLMFFSRNKQAATKALHNYATIEPRVVHRTNLVSVLFTAAGFSLCLLAEWKGMLTIWAYCLVNTLLINYVLQHWIKARLQRIAAG